MEPNQNLNQNPNPNPNPNLNNEQIINNDFNTNNGANNDAVSGVALQEKMKAEKKISVVSTIISVVWLLALIPGFFMWFFDGQCAGGGYCHQAPGGFALAGSALMALLSASVIMRRMNKRGIDTRKIVTVCLVVYFFVAVFLFVCRYLLFRSWAHK